MEINVKIGEFYKHKEQKSQCWVVGGWCEARVTGLKAGWISCHLLAIVARLQGEGSASQQCATREPS